MKAPYRRSGVVAAGSLSVITAAALLAATSAPAAEPKPPADASTNQLTPAEKAAGWHLLFDGHTTAGWQSFKKETFPEKGWVVEGSCLKHLAGQGGGDLISRGTYDHFD